MKNRNKVIVGAAIITLALNLANCTRRTQDQTGSVPRSDSENMAGTNQSQTGTNQSQTGMNQSETGTNQADTSGTTAGNTGASGSQAGTSGQMGAPGGMAGSESDLQDRVETALQNDPQISNPDRIKVSASGGQVILEGNVSSQAEEIVALDKAKQVAGTTPVVDRLEVQVED